MTVRFKRLCLGQGHCLLRAGNPHAGRSAFSLIEVLVIISIMSLLLTMLLPAFGAMRESMRRLKCATQQRSLLMANQTFATDRQGKYVTIIPSKAFENLTSMARYGDMMNSSYLIYKNSSVTVPPSNIYILYGLLYEEYLNRDGRSYWCPSALPPAFVMSDPKNGIRKLGMSYADMPVVNVKIAYYQRGFFQQAPINQRGDVIDKNRSTSSRYVWGKDSRSRRVMLADHYKTGDTHQGIIQEPYFFTNHQGYMNLGMSDSSVRGVYVTDFSFFPNGYFQAPHYGEDYGNPLVPGPWSLLDDMVR